jgi:hypothetical protein
MTAPDKHQKPANKTERDEDSDRAGGRAPLGHEIRQRIARPHKGEVGRPETNEEIFQGSKMKELE